MTATRVNPHTLAGWLDVDLTEATTSTTGGSATAVKPVNLANYPQVKAAVEKTTKDRSKDTLRIVGACYDDHLTLE